MRLSTLIASLIFVLPASAADMLPSQYVGIWATENSVFRGSNLIGGNAIYLDADGTGAMVGAPLPVGMCGDHVCTPVIGMPFHASVESGSTIRAVLADGNKTPDVTLVYDPEAKTLVMTSRDDKELRFVRRESRLSSDIRSALHEGQRIAAGARRQP